MTNYIGLMSGTSLDGVDGTLVAFGESDADLQVRAHAHRPFDGALRSELLALNTPGPAELHRAALAANALVGVYAEVVKALLEQSGISRQQVRAIGAHGQTVRHRPGEFDGIGYTVQLNAPALLAEHTGIDVVADFRSRDIAAGGTGAPLVPAFHRALFGRPDATVAVLNLGGIANLTVLHRDGRTIGFDCGPANVLMDLWMHRHSGAPFDADGAWAASGTVVPSLLASMQADPYFTRSPPKSTGRDLFDAAWLERHLRAAALEPPCAGCPSHARGAHRAGLRPRHDPPRVGCARSAGVRRRRAEQRFDDAASRGTCLTSRFDRQTVPACQRTRSRPAHSRGLLGHRSNESPATCRK